MFNFQLGLRVGELVAIKWTDIENDYIYIKRMEIADYKIERDEEVVRNGCKIVDFTKSSAGVRSIYLKKEARKIFCMRCVMSCIFKKRAVIKLERHLYLRYLIMDLILIKYVRLLVMRMKGQALIITVLIEGAMTLRKTF